MKSWFYMRRYQRAGSPIRLHTLTKAIVISLLLFLAVQQLVFIGLSRLRIRSTNAEEIKFPAVSMAGVRYLSVNNTLYRQRLEKQDSQRYLSIPSALLSNSSTLNPSLADPSPYLIRRCLHSARKALSLQHTLDANGAARPEWRRKASEMMQREVDACLAALEADRKGGGGEGNALLQAILQEEGRSKGEGKGESEEHRGRLKAGEAKEARNSLSTIKRLRTKLEASEAQVKQLTFEKTLYSQIASKAVPQVLHCVVLRLTLSSANASGALTPMTGAITTPTNTNTTTTTATTTSVNTAATAATTLPSSSSPPADPRLQDPSLFHYALFSDNIVAVAVVVNSTAQAAVKPHLHVFHVVTDRLHLTAMREWFRLHPPRGNMAWEVKSLDDYPWINPVSVPVLRQIGTEALRNYYFRVPHVHRSNSSSLSHEVVGDIKYRNPKYLYILNHLRFYLPRLFPSIHKVLFLDDDVVVQKDLSSLWQVPMHGNVNLAVETCGVVFHRFKTYLNFSSPLLKDYDPEGCGWAYGMNLFDLNVWRKSNFTERYHFWQLQNENRTLWRLGTLPPALLTFYNATLPLDKQWHVLGLGSKDNIDLKLVERAAVLHYNGHAKPWLELAIPVYHKYWARHAPYGVDVFKTCNFMPPHHAS